MIVKKLREALADLPDDMPVLVPTGMDWAFLVDARRAKLEGGGGGYWKPAKEGSEEALFLAPSHLSKD